MDRLPEFLNTFLALCPKHRLRSRFLLIYDWAVLLIDRIQGWNNIEIKKDANHNRITNIIDHFILESLIHLDFTFILDIIKVQ